MRRNTVLAGVRLASDLRECGVDHLTATPVDVRVRGERITDVGQNLPEEHEEFRLNCDGLIAFTGLVDMHVHLRQPGFEQSETVHSGSRAAAAGGFTTVYAMANTDPVADSAGVVEQVHALGVSVGLTRVQPIGAVTAGLRGERLSEIGAMARSRAGVRVFSDDGKCVHDSLLMRRALEYVSTFDGVIAQHAQDPRLTEDAQMNEGELSSELGLRGWPAVAEEAIIARDALLAKHVGARLHVCHLSTAGSVEVVRWAKTQGANITAEVTPHHLLLTEELARSYDARFKVNPPLRREEDVLALREAVAAGVIDIVATDHAPHPPEAKECGWAEGAFGMVGMESAFSVVLQTLIQPGHASWAKVQQLLSQKPAQIASLKGHPKKIAAGEIADITIVDPRGSSEFTVKSLHGKSRNSPFLGLHLPGSVKHTMLAGDFTLLDGVVQDRAGNDRNGKE